MAYRRGALEKATAFLAELCAQGVGGRLPPIARMAVQAGTGGGTMWRAVRELCARGTLSARPGAGTRVVQTFTATVPARDPDPAPKPKWRWLAAELRSAIDTGSFGSHPALPHPGALCREYGVNHRTLRRALDQLVREGLIRPHGRTYRAVSWEGVRPGSRIVLVGRGTALGELDLPTFRSRNHLFLLESLCARAGVTLEVATLYWVGTSPTGGLERVTRALSPRGGGAVLLGCLVWTAGLDQRMLSRLMPVLSRTECPVGILDETEPPPDLRPWLVSGRFRCFTMGHSSAAGEAIGRCLLGFGHRRVLYVDPSGTHWSKARLAGLQRTFRQSGVADGVESLEIGPDTAGAPAADSTGRMLDNAARRIEALRRRLEPLGTLASRRLVTQLSNTTGAIAVSHARRWKLAHALYPRLERSQATALVGCNDEAALDCLDVLADRGIRVPDAMGVVGFDDGHSASSYGLTTYNFNGQAALHALVNHLLTCTPAQAHRPFAGVEEVAGFVVHRATLRPAGGRAAPRLA